MTRSSHEVVVDEAEMMEQIAPLLDCTAHLDIHLTSFCPAAACYCGYLMTNPPVHQMISVMCSVIHSCLIHAAGSCLESLLSESSLSEGHSERLEGNFERPDCRIDRCWQTARKPALSTGRRSNMKGPSFQGAQNVLTARLDQLSGDRRKTECMENPVRLTQLTSLTEASCDFCNSTEDCTAVVEKVRGSYDPLNMYSTTAGRSPQPWAEEWLLRAVRLRRTAECEAVGIATNCSAYTVYPRCQN